MHYLSVSSGYFYDYYCFSGNKAKDTTAYLIGIKGIAWDAQFLIPVVFLIPVQFRNLVQTQLCKEYGVSQSALATWIKQHSTVEITDGEVLTPKQVKELQKRNAQLEEENLIVKK